MSENIICWQNKTGAGLVSAELRTAKLEDYLASSKEMGRLVIDGWEATLLQKLQVD